MVKRIVNTVVLVLSIALSVMGQEIPSPMSPPRLVNDFAGLLSSDEQYSLEKRLRDYHDTTSTQVYVVIVNDLAGYDISDFAFRVGEKWGVGQKGSDNGIVIAIKPKIGNERGQAFIAIGYGLEDVIPDAAANRIIDQEMIPFFKANRYYDGLVAAHVVIAELASGKYSADKYMQGGENIGFAFLFIAFIIFVVVVSIASKSNAKGRHIGHNVPLWIALGMLANSGSRGGGFGNFSSGGGGFGGFSGGGGGSFGGGGAGGSW